MHWSGRASRATSAPDAFGGVHRGLRLHTLTKGELSLVAAGKVDAVHSMRRTFHELLCDEAVATVEAVLGRRVISCLADVDPAANVAAMMFVLDSLPDPSGAAV